MKVKSRSFFVIPSGLFVIPSAAEGSILKSLNALRMREHNYYVYIVSSNNQKTIYIGVTNNLEKRVYEHKNKMIKGFTSKYNCVNLVYYEDYNDISLAISREKQLKKWRRSKKEFLIIKQNPLWKDLSDGWY